MAIDKEIARLSKILVDTDGIPFADAEARLRGLKLAIVIGRDSASPAAHAAVLTAISVGRRTFLGGVSVGGAIDQPVLTAVPIDGYTLGEACVSIGARGFDGEASFTITVGGDHHVDDVSSVATWWDGWNAGVRGTGDSATGDGSNPLAGIVAGAMAVGHGFQIVRDPPTEMPADIDLWGQPDPPAFSEVWLPGAIWIAGLGNLGQALCWAVASMPYDRPADVRLILHDFDVVSPENWGTSVLVPDDAYGVLKTKLVETWLYRRGFDVRRIDRRLTAIDRVAGDEPRLAFSGLDKVSARRDMAALGFSAIVDAGLGRTAHDFDRFRVSVFHDGRPIDAHFRDTDETLRPDLLDTPAYKELADADRCGAAEIAGASVAVPHVSAIAAAIALSRMIALTSGLKVSPSMVRRVSAPSVRANTLAENPNCRGVSHAGRPQMIRLRATTN